MRLHIKSIIENTITVNIEVIIPVIVFVFIIFPIFVNIEIDYNSQEKKAYFKLKIFKIVKILNGYVECIKEGFAFHLTKNKVAIYPYKKLLTLKEGVKPLQDYHFMMVKLCVKIGDENNLIKPIGTAFVLSYVQYFIKWYFYHNKPYLKLDDNYAVYIGEDFIVASLNSMLILNILMILISLIKILVGKIVNGIRKQNKFGN